MQPRTTWVDGDLYYDYKYFNMYDITYGAWGGWVWLDSSVGAYKKVYALDFRWNIFLSDLYCVDRTGSLIYVYSDVKEIPDGLEQYIALDRF